MLRAQARLLLSHALNHLVNLRTQRGAAHGIRPQHLLHLCNFRIRVAHAALNDLISTPPRSHGRVEQAKFRGCAEACR